MALRDQGGIRKGDKVLVNGASGGVGTFAVQIAHVLGAEVTGVYVVVGGPPGRWLQPAGYMMSALLRSPFVSQKMVMTDVAGSTQNKQNLLTLTGFIEDGKITPVIDRGYPFEEIPAAIRYQEEGHAKGKVVVTI